MLPFAFTDLPDEIQHSASHKFLSKGEILLQQGDAAESIYWVTTGQIRLVSFVNQQMVTHYFVGVGELLGESALYMPTYGCTVIAEIPSGVQAVPVSTFASALHQDPVLAKRYLQHLTLRFASTKALLELRSISSARDRLLHYLLKRRVSNQNIVTLDKPLRAIASELALTPEALSRLLSRLQTEGLITHKKRSITFSQEWLEEFANY